jgi:hypothetical protein
LNLIGAEGESPIQGIRVFAGIVFWVYSIALHWIASLIDFLKVWERNLFLKIELLKEYEK